MHHLLTVIYLNQYVPLAHCHIAVIYLSNHWQEEWTNSDARNQFLIVNATAHVPGSDLPRRLWSLLNRFRTGQGLCAANHHLWGLRADLLCECGIRHSMTYIVEDCHLTRLQGGLRARHSADEAAVVWLDMTSKR